MNKWKELGERIPNHIEKCMMRCVMKKSLLVLLILSIILIYFQLDRTNETMGKSTLSSKLLDKSLVEWIVKKDKVSVQLLDEHNKPITKLEKIDQDKIKIVAINNNFDSFEHISSNYKGNGVFQGKYQHDKNDAYSFFLFVEDDATSYVLSTFQMDNWEKTEIPKDVLLNKTIKNVNAILHFPPLFEQEQSELVFQLDGNKGKNKLNPFVEQIGVLYMIDEEATTMELIYPEVQSDEENITFKVLFSKAGIYKIWGEFQWNGRTVIFPYVVQVQKRE